ncbi:hypothetical protein CYMTET_29351, partial [Cymbomonas tetramitiformis]
MVICVLTIVLHACNIERINKDADAAHSKSRPRFGDSNSKKAIYCYVNLSLQFKANLSVKEYLKTVLNEEDEENVLLSFQEVAEDSSDEELPAGREEAGDNEDSSDDDEVAEPPQDVDSRLPFECPIGFQALEKPAAFITSATGVTDLFIVMLWKEDGWELGK